MSAIKQSIKKTTWNTYATRCYTYDVANDQRSAGGVHLHQVRWTPDGWQTRILQTNGRFSAAGPVEPVRDNAEGAALFATAQQG